MSQFKIFEALSGQDYPCIICGQHGCDLVLQENFPGGGSYGIHSDCYNLFEKRTHINRYARVEIRDVGEETLVWVQRWGRAASNVYFVTEASYDRLMVILGDCFDYIRIPEDYAFDIYEAMPNA